MLGLKFQEVSDFKQASRRICARVLQDTRDWQIGHTKVFLKVGKYPYTLCSIDPSPPPTQDQDDLYLEEERDHVLTGFVILIQKWVRGYFQRKRYRAMKGAVLILQKNYRRHYWMKRYRIVSYVVTMVIRCICELRTGWVMVTMVTVVPAAHGVRYCQTQ